ncbi:MAG: 16S rRNA (guanine(527)-N(7))-methyltransferase RsmG [Spirochaetes bacterium RBG_16_67_19]|nr:MAG: 16S rRNA (guanine(527)-N(7))-methyltransferase RsmG [Spirochaetes bacterium RBG_16_67_19]
MQGRGEGRSEALIAEGLELLAIDCPPARLQALERYRLELELWNRRYGFVKASGDDLVVRHFLDSLAGLPVLARLSPRRTVLDVGSGAGFPGLPLALFLEDSRFVLLERSARKAAFLGNVVALLGLANVRVLEMQLRGLEERFDLVTFRAWSPLDRELPALRRVLAPGGVIAAYKGRRERIEAELRAAGLSAGEAGRSPLEAAVVPLRVPFLEGEERHLVLVRG